MQTIGNEDSPFEQERKAIRFLEENFTKNKRRMKNVVRRMMPDHPEFIQEGLLRNVLITTDPIGYVRTAINQSYEFEAILKNQIENGNHGFIVYKREIFPVCLNTQPHWLKSTARWVVEQEMELHKELIDAWMKDQELDYAPDIKIVLFQEFGFSGFPRGYTRDFRKRKH